MLNKLRGLLKRSSFSRYLFVGGITYVIDIGVLIGLYAGVHTSRALAASASFWIGLFSSFLCQKLLAFQDYQREIKAISRQALAYGVLVAINYALTVAIVDLFPGRYIVYSRTLALVVTTVWNYTIYKRLVFRQSRGKTSKSSDD